jgi:predicted nucleic acid-binding protein
MTMPERVVLDASVLVSAVDSRDAKHVASYGFLRDHRDTVWLVPTIAYFEFQAAQSRLRREGQSAIRDLYLENAKPYSITQQTLRRASRRGLFETLSPLRGADLVYACIAALEDAPLATHDQQFHAVESLIPVLWI